MSFIQMNKSYTMGNVFITPQFLITADSWVTILSTETDPDSFISIDYPSGKVIIKANDFILDGKNKYTLGVEFLHDLDDSIKLLNSDGYVSFNKYCLVVPDNNSIDFQIYKDKIPSEDWNLTMKIFQRYKNLRAFK